MQVISWRDLDGFFEHVWTVHPMVGASPVDALNAIGPVSSETLSPRHTVIESHSGRWKWLERLPIINFVAAQGSLFCRLSRLIHSEQISVIRAGDPYYLGLFGYVLAKVNRIPLVIFVNGNSDAIYESVRTLSYPRLLPFKWLEKMVGRWSLSRSDLVVALNKNNLEFAVTNGTPPEKGAVLPLGNMLAPIHFLPPGERTSVVGDVGIVDVPFLIYVGRLEVVKHPEDVIAVLAEARLAKPNLKALLVGQGSMAEELKKTASSLGVEDAVVLAGERDQSWVADALAESSVVVSPLAGFALAEACLSGTPVVAYDVEWHAELIQDGDSGLLVPYRDTHAMAMAVGKVLSDPPLGESLGSRGRDRALMLMDPRLLNERHSKRYSALLEGQKGPV